MTQGQILAAVEVAPQEASDLSRQSSRKLATHHANYVSPSEFERAKYLRTCPPVYPFGAAIKSAHFTSVFFGSAVCMYNTAHLVCTDPHVTFPCSHPGDLENFAIR